jgi:hypothetical protein
MVRNERISYSSFISYGICRGETYIKINITVVLLIIKVVVAAAAA